ncbi:MAG: AraC family transcriptional regulator [Pseudomonadota bacterium]
MTDIVGLMSESMGLEPRAVLRPPMPVAHAIESSVLQAAFWGVDGRHPTTVSSPASRDYALLAVALDRPFKQELQIDGASIHKGVSTPGEYMIAPPGSAIESEVQTGASVIHLYLPNQMFQTVVPRSLTDGPSYGHSPKLHRKLNDLIAWRADANTDDTLDMAAYGSLLQITADLARSLAPADTGERLTPRMVARVDAMMRAHLEGALKVADLANALTMSEAHFARAFRNTTGQTPGEALRKMRMEKARDLLEADTLGILDIAAAVGYADPSSFAKAFKDSYGVTPNRFRTTLKRAQALVHRH